MYYVYSIQTLLIVPLTILASNKIAEKLRETNLDPSIKTGGEDFGRIDAVNALFLSALEKHGTLRFQNIVDAKFYGNVESCEKGWWRKL